MRYPTQEMLITKTPTWKMVILHRVAQALGVLIKIEGWPLGSNRNIDFSRNRGTFAQACKGGAVGNGNQQ